MLDSNQGGDIAPFETIDQPPGNRLPSNVSGTQPTENNSGHGVTNANRLRQPAFTLSYDGQLAQTLNDALTGIANEAENIRKLINLAGTPSASARTIRELQAEVNLCLAEIDRISAQTEFNGVHVLQGGGTMRAPAGIGSNETFAFALKTIDVASLGLQNFSIAGPKTNAHAVWASTIVSRPDDFLLPHDLEVSLTIDGEPTSGFVLQDGFNNIFVKIVAGAVGNPSDQAKFYRADKEEFIVVDGPNLKRPAISLADNILSSDLSFPISHSFRDGPKAGDPISGGGAYSNPKSYLRSSEGPLILQAIKMHSTPLDIKVDGKPTNGQLVSTGLNHEERRYVKLAARAVGNPSNEDKFYPYTDSDYFLTHEDGFEFGRPTKVNVTAHFAIRSTDLRSKVQNAPLSVLEFAVAQLSAWRDEINHLGLSE